MRFSTASPGSAPACENSGMPSRYAMRVGMDWMP